MKVGKQSKQRGSWRRGNIRSKTVIVIFSFFVIFVVWTEHKTLLLSDEEADSYQRLSRSSHVEKATSNEGTVKMVTKIESTSDDAARQTVDTIPISQKGENTASSRGKEADFTITVLTMNRVRSLERLLHSLEATNYGNDMIDLIIKIDHSPTQNETLAFANAFDFSRGRKRVIAANENMGLARSWFEAWTPKHDKDYGIILEDDLEVASDVWYTWLKKAWSIYDKNASQPPTDLGGISLNRQSLVPKKPHRTEEIVNDHQPFLYPLVGTYGFSPHPAQWLKFINWMESIDVATFDVSTPGLITSEWWNTVEKRHMWSQHFIYFTNQHDLFILYVNLPNEKTLTAHMREKGEHYASTQGRDFELATEDEVDMNFPEYGALNRYDWDAKLIIASSVQRIMNLFRGEAQG